MRKDGVGPERSSVPERPRFLYAPFSQLRFHVSFRCIYMEGVPVEVTVRLNDLAGKLGIGIDGINPSDGFSSHRTGGPPLITVHFHGR